MTKNLCSKHFCNHKRKISRDSPRKSKPVFYFRRYIPLTMTKLENIRVTFSSCRHYSNCVISPWPTTTISSFSSLIKHFYAKWDHCLQIIINQNISFGFLLFIYLFIFFFFGGGGLESHLYRRFSPIWLVMKQH